MSGFSIHSATPDDAALLLELVKELATYERLAHEVVATPDEIRESLFGKNRRAEALLLREGDKAVAFAIFFHNFSTFVGRAGIYLEDIYVKPEYRGKGYGKRLFQEVAKIAVERNCGRYEWAVLDWNQPAIDFYKSFGARAMSDWTVFRLDGDELRRLAGSL